MRELNARALTHAHKSGIFGNLAAFKQLAPRLPGTSTIRQVLLDVNMINRQDGLCRIAYKRGIKVEEMKRGDFLLFLNAKGSQIALLTRDEENDMIHIVNSKHPRGHKISHLLLKHVPGMFQGQALAYDEALKPVLQHWLSRKPSLPPRA